MSDSAELPSVAIPGAPESVAQPPTKAEKREHEVLKAEKQAFRNLLEQQKERRKLDKVAKAEKEPQEATAAPEAKPEPVKVAPEPPKAAAPSPELEKLRAKLLLAGAPKKAIETLSDDEVRDWWKGQEERVKNDTLAYQRASEAEKKLAALQGTTEKVAEQVPTATSDLQEIASELADKFGEDETGVLLTALQKLVAPLQRELKETRDILANARERGLQDISTKNRDRLAAKLPMLKENDNAWKVIQAQALERSKSDPSKFSSADAVYDDVFNDLYGGIQVEAPRVAPVPDKAADEKARVQASALTPPGTTKREKKVTPMDAAFAAFKLLRKNPEDLDGAKRAFSQASLPQ